MGNVRTLGDCIGPVVKYLMDVASCWEPRWQAGNRASPVERPLVTSLTSLTDYRPWTLGRSRGPLVPWVSPVVQKRESLSIFVVPLSGSQTKDGPGSGDKGYTAGD